MARAKNRGTEEATVGLSRILDQLSERASSREASPKEKRSLITEIEKVRAKLNAVVVAFDPVQRPSFVFDPGNPRTVGFFVALALNIQERRPLTALRPFYGGGVYALYYNGAFGAYAPLSGSDTPIYVGLAVGGIEGAVDITGYGSPLFSRLCEHRRSIERAHESLSIADFECRALVLQSGWESTAETYLIRLFEPIWNKETKILYGFGKHGDNASTRKNKRSPWDTFHIGRQWAGNNDLVDKKSPAQIESLLASHFAKTKVFKNFDEILAAFKQSLRQE